ncbi:MAG: alpha/beta fold hydrolase [Chitinophagales bacterium]
MQLNYKKFGTEGPPIIILHGLLGSLDNWQTIAKTLSDSHQVYIIDQRNHGRSPHAQEMSYEVLANDVVEFCEQQHLTNTSFIGHSMGGKVAMMLALHHPGLIDKLIIVDIAPVYYEGGHESILFAMAEAPLHTTTDRKVIDAFLEKRISEFGVRQFVLKNLSRDENGQLSWKCNLEALIKNYRNLMLFPDFADVFNKSVYFIKGDSSDYINAANWKDCLRYFPAAELLSVAQSGHWVHADNPQGFINQLLNIL